MDAAQNYSLISLFGSRSSSKFGLEPLNVLFDVVLNDFDPLYDDLFKNLLSLGR